MASIKVFLKGVYIKCFGYHCSSIREFYKIRDRLIFIKLNRLRGRFLSTYIDQDNYTLCMYPIFFLSWKNYFFLEVKGKDPLWDEGDLYEQDARGKKFNKMANFTLAYLEELLKKLNFNKKAVLMDVGCAGGWYLRKFEKNGWSNLIGVEPGRLPCDHLRSNSKKIKVYNEFFGIGNHINEKPDIILFNGSIDRIPYGNSLTALNKLSPKAIIIITSPFIENYPRDWNQLISSMGYVCVEKNTFKILDDGSFVKIFDVDNVDLGMVNSMLIFSKLPESFGN